MLPEKDKSFAMRVTTFFFSRNRLRRVGLVCLAVLVVLIPSAIFAISRQQSLGDKRINTPGLTAIPTTSRTVSVASVSPVGNDALQHYEYVFPDGEMCVYDMDHGHKLAKCVDLPTMAGVRGVIAAPATHMLYISYGGDGGGNGDGFLLK